MTAAVYVSVTLPSEAGHVGLLLDVDWNKLTPSDSAFINDIIRQFYDFGEVRWETIRTDGRGTCPACGGEFQLRRDLLIRGHSYCKGSYESPVERVAL